MLNKINKPIKSLLLIIVSVLFIAASFKVYHVYKMINPDALSFWLTNNETSMLEIDHSAWQHILDNYLVLSHQAIKNTNNERRLFSYQTVSHHDKQVLSNYIDYLQTIDPREYNKNQQFAYWVNLYNALTIKIVLDNYPIKSIKEIGDGYSGPWNTKYLLIAKQKLSLNDIEHNILRAIWQDKRIHYVVNCASMSCPDLLPHTLNAKTLEQQLNRAAEYYINHPNTIIFDERTIKLSSIYNWFSSDFGETQQALLNHLKHYAKPELKTQLSLFSGELKFDYDWKLNEPQQGLVN